MITAVFDLDGTIADTVDDLADAVNYGLRELGFPERTVDEIRSFIGNGVEKLCLRALPDDGKDSLDELHRLFDVYYSGHYLDKTVLYPQIGELMRKLSDSGVVLAVATNKPQEFSADIIGELLPDVSFAAVLGGCSYRPKKPDTAILVEIFAKLPDVENRVYMVGDSKVDIELAQNAGITSIGCPWGFRGVDELREAGADYIVNSPLEIAEIILGGGV